MIRTLFGTLLLLVTLSTEAQYYYKDIVTPRQTMDQLKKYRQEGIRTVNVSSYESNGELTRDFAGNQTVSDNYTTVKTFLNTALTGESALTTTFNAKGQLLRSVDTTDGARSETYFEYDSEGRLTKVVNVSTSAGQRKEKEEHLWIYDAKGRPEKMLRIKNDIDTTQVLFVLDEQGNVAEENATRKGSSLPSYYYYYDDNNRLTDIVTYNDKAKRLLPVYIFEYDREGAIRTMMIVPEGSDDYQKWYYEYNAGGLKTKETCFNKRKQLMGRIEYRYQ